MNPKLESIKQPPSSFFPLFNLYLNHLALLHNIRETRVTSTEIEVTWDEENIPNALLVRCQPLETFDGAIGPSEAYVIDTAACLDLEEYIYYNITLYAIGGGSIHVGSSTGISARGNEYLGSIIVRTLQDGKARLD